MCADLATAATVVSPLLPGELLVAGGAAEAVQIRHPVSGGTGGIGGASIHSNKPQPCTGRHEKLSSLSSTVYSKPYSNNIGLELMGLVWLNVVECG